MRRARRSFALCAVVFLVIGGMIIYFLFNSFVIPGMEKTIQALQTTSGALSTVPTGPPVIWSGPTNALSVTNQYCIYRATSDCAITNVVNPSSTAVAYAVVTIHNTSSKAITFSMTDSSVRRLGTDATNTLRIASGRIGVVSVTFYGREFGIWAAAQQQ